MSNDGQKVKIIPGYSSTTSGTEKSENIFLSVCNKQAAKDDVVGWQCNYQTKIGK